MRQAITTVTKALSLPPESFRLVRTTRYEQVLFDVLARFTTLSRRGVSSSWLWEHFKEPRLSLRNTDGLFALQSLLPDCEEVWFLAEDEDHKSTGNYWVYQARVGSVVKVLSALPFFEYYVVAQHMEWLLCETHHDEVIVLGEALINRVQKLYGLGKGA